MSCVPKRLLVLFFTLFTIIPCGAGDKRTAEEKGLDDERAQSNGILVAQPKVYDDSVLQQMLSTAEARLASLQILDQTGISTRLGSITGATQTTTSFGLSIQGPPIAQAVTTANGATNSAVTGAQNSTTQGVGTNGPTSSTTASTSSQNTANAPVTNVVTTSPQLNPPAVTAPAPSTSLPSSFSVSASDILNEQMQLTYEIANLRLLLEGSLNDRILLDKSDPNNIKKIVKPRVTLGFPVTLLPDKRYTEAIAVVEVEIEKVPCSEGKLTCESSLSNDPPAVVALLPREKTYNVGSITDSSLSIGAGVVTQVVGVSGSFLRGRKTYYLVQDQDTVALTFQPKDPNRVGFLWEFRPVLGAKLLREGLKQTFVQIALPASWSADPLGTVYVRTYWRDYDARKNLVKGIRAGSLTPVKPYPIPNLPIDQSPKVFSTASLEDLGNGQMLVNLSGRFLGGTYVRVGSNTLREGSPNFSLEYQGIRFVAPIADLATKGAVLVARDGTETPLLLHTDSKDVHLTINKCTVRTVDDANSQVSVEMKEIPDFPKNLPLIMLIGGKVFGYSDAPFVQQGNVLSTVVPTSLLVANPQVAVRSLFTDKSYWSAPAAINNVVGGSVTPKLAVLETGPDSARFLLYGARVGDGAKVLSPENGALDPFGKPPSAELRTITLNKAQVKSQKLVIVQTADGFIFQVAVPSVELPDATKPSIKPVQPVTVGTDEAAFKGEGLNALQKVVFNGIELKLRKQADGKVIWLKGLKAAGVTGEAKQQSLDFYFKTGKQAISVDVVAP